MNLSITEYKPSPDLSSYIDSFWIGTFNLSGQQNFSQNIVPNGCIELILHFSDDHCFLKRTKDFFSKSPDYTLLGVYSQPYTVKFSSPVDAMGIRFFPDGFRNILGVPPRHFLATYEDGFDVVGNKLQEFWSKLRESAKVEERLRMANHFFRQQLYQNEVVHDKTHLAMQLVRRKNGIIDFKELSKHVPVSLRHLQREFKNYYGITITDYIRLSRLNAINKQMMANPGRLTELAHNLDFSDQSHFIKEFKHYVGLAPKKFMRQKADYIVNAV